MEFIIAVVICLIPVSMIVLGFAIIGYIPYHLSKKKQKQEQLSIPIIKTFDEQLNSLGVQKVEVVRHTTPIAIEIMDEYTIEEYWKGGDKVYRLMHHDLGDLGVEFKDRSVVQTIINLFKVEYAEEFAQLEKQHKKERKNDIVKVRFIK
jgi:hypothetical protein